MIFKKELPFFQAISTMVGLIIGAGILGIPYVFAKAGFITGSVVLVIIAFAMVSMKLLFGEVTLRTYGKHQLVGYVDKYMGRNWRNFTSIIFIITIVGSLLAYFVGIGQVLSEVFGGEQLMWGLAFYVLAAYILFFGIKLIKNIEFILTGFIFLIVLLIVFLSHQHVELGNLVTFNWTKLAIPYGVVLFACSGMIAVPEVRQILFRKERLFKKAIFIGALIPPIIYFIFAWVIVGVTGLDTTQIATIGLGNVIGPIIFIIGNLFAFLTMTTSFLTSGLGLKEVLNFDFKIKHLLAWLITVLAPLFIYFIGFQNFISILALVGALGFGVNGTIYIACYWFAKKNGERHPEYSLPTWFTMPVSVLLVILFIGGLIYTILDLI